MAFSSTLIATGTFSVCTFMRTFLANRPETGHKDMPLIGWSKLSAILNFVSLFSKLNMHIKCVYDIISDINKKHYQFYFTIVYEQCY